MRSSFSHLHDFYIRLPKLRRVFDARYLLLGVLLLAACQPTAPANTQPTPIPFPTMTPGRLIHGVLPVTNGLSLDSSGVANPATAIALSNRPTATPDYRICPAQASPAIPPQPARGLEMTAAITNYLSAGGSPVTLSETLQNTWNALGETGTVRADLDLTGEGTPDVLLAYAAPDDGGTLLILTCEGGVYAPLYQAITGGDAPQVIHLGDMNFDSLNDVLFASFTCAPDNPDDCSYRTQLLTWKPDTGRFNSLLNGPITSSSLPTASDMDNDQVQEVVVRLDNSGTSSTGPLRTGVNIYDWNGTAFTLSIVQLDPPRFEIQVVQQADSSFSRLDAEQAISLYNLALNSEALRYWFNDEPTVLKSYVYYRLMLAYAYTDNEELLTTYQAAIGEFPDPANAPVYVAIINAFWNGWQVTNNLHSACLEVQAIISARPEAVTLLNRYGSRSPTYTAQDLCPF